MISLNCWSHFRVEPKLPDNLYSLDLEIFAYILTRDGNEFLQLQQDLLLWVLDAVQAAGTALALPTQASISYSPDGPLTSNGVSSSPPADREPVSSKTDGSRS